MRAAAASFQAASTSMAAAAECMFVLDLKLSRCEGHSEVLSFPLKLFAETKGDVPSKVSSQI